MQVLILGAHSYIGNSLTNYINERIPLWIVDRVSVRDDNWKCTDFTKYDCVLYCAGIVHVKENAKNRELYYRVNKDLAVETAQFAKKSGVKHFIYLSSMSIYGIETGIVSKDTVPKPESAYGRSKLEAEQMLMELSYEYFRVTIVRPPMVYGNGCKGNYQALRKYALTVPVFPDYPNQRSMISIDNLCEELTNEIQDCIEGVILPQDPEYASTSQMVKRIAIENGKRMFLIKGLGWMIRIGMHFSKKCRKVFGSLVYAK